MGSTAHIPLFRVIVDGARLGYLNRMSSDPISRLAEVLRLPRGYVRDRAFRVAIEALALVCRLRAEKTGESFRALLMDGFRAATELSLEPDRKLS